jgi:hypothetical protein
MGGRSKKRASGPRQYRVYLAWGKSGGDLLDGMECLLRPRHAREDRFNLVDGEGATVTAVSRSVEFVLVDDSAFTERDIPAGSREVYLRIVRRRLFGRILVHAEPVGSPPRGCVLSGRTGRVVWGGADVVKDISPRPIPLRYWIKDEPYDFGSPSVRPTRSDRGRPTTSSASRHGQRQRARNRASETL